MMVTKDDDEVMQHLPEWMQLLRKLIKETKVDIIRHDLTRLFLCLLCNNRGYLSQAEWEYLLHGFSVLIQP